MPWLVETIRFGVSVWPNLKGENSCGKCEALLSVIYALNHKYMGYRVQASLMTDRDQTQPVRHESDLIVHYAMPIANTISSAMRA